MRICHDEWSDTNVDEAMAWAAVKAMRDACEFVVSGWRLHDDHSQISQS